VEKLRAPADGAGRLERGGAEVVEAAEGVEAAGFGAAAAKRCSTSRGMCAPSCDEAASGTGEAVEADVSKESEGGRRIDSDASAGFVEAPAAAAPAEEPDGTAGCAPGGVSTISASGRS
jgi:hypothetical protein